MTRSGAATCSGENGLSRLPRALQRAGAGGREARAVRLEVRGQRGGLRLAGRREIEIGAAADAGHGVTLVEGIAVPDDEKRRRHDVCGSPCCASIAAAWSASAGVSIPDMGRRDGATSTA